MRKFEPIEDGLWGEEKFQNNRIYSTRDLEKIATSTRRDEQYCRKRQEQFLQFGIRSQTQPSNGRCWSSQVFSWMETRTSATPLRNRGGLWRPNSGIRKTNQGNVRYEFAFSNFRFHIEKSWTIFPDQSCGTFASTFSNSKGSKRSPFCNQEKTPDRHLYCVSITALSPWFISACHVRMLYNALEQILLIEWSGQESM